MLQNLKNFLIAFVTGLIVFGICAVLIINFGMRAISGPQTDSDETLPNDEQIVSYIE